MKLIKHDSWIKGDSYQKRILLDNFDKQINLIEDVIIEAGGEVPIHSHDFTDEIFYITKNSATMIVNNEQLEVSSGDMIYVDKKEQHGFKNNNDKKLKIIVMKVNFKQGDSYLK